MALLLTAAVVVAGIRALGTKPTVPVAPPVAPAVPPDWKTFQNRTYNVQFRYPPDWVVKQQGGFVIVPRELSPNSSKPSTVGLGGCAQALSGLDHSAEGPGSQRFEISRQQLAVIGSRLVEVFCH